jgi:predicted AAA+ superfamily ATPase
MQRKQAELIKKDLEKKMVFLVGPRQSGKTWLAKQIALDYKSSLYLNYDSFEDKKIIDEQSWNPELDLIIFDELHKKSDWKNYIKGVFDTKQNNTRILVTGSARLDIYDCVGDSLAGRYFRHRLLPFSLAELKQVGAEISLTKLIERSGFPEPLLAEMDLDAHRWRQQYINSLLSTDIFEFDRIQNFKALRLLFELLRKRVGSPVSYQSLSEDIAISPNTVKKYIEILEALFVIFLVRPYSKNIARSILKEPKIYFFDTALVDSDSGACFENLVALSLLKNIYAQNDYLAKDLNLHYLRTKDGIEVDFAIINKSKLELIVEAKVSEKKLDRGLINFAKNYQYDGIQVVQNLTKEIQESNLRLVPASSYLSSLYL